MLKLFYQLVFNTLFSRHHMLKNNNMIFVFRLKTIKHYNNNYKNSTFVYIMQGFALNYNQLIINSIEKIMMKIDSDIKNT